MPKYEHDEIAAKEFRKPDYNKPWHLKGIEILSGLDLQNKKILDLGCGNGEFAKIMRDKYSADITCLDYSESHLERIKDSGFPFIKCNFDNIEDIKNLNADYKEKFDIITCFEVIEHIFDTDEILASSHNLLKKDGVMLISTPNINYTANRIYSMFRGNIPACEGHHVRFFDLRRLQQILILNGFEYLEDFSFGKNYDYLNRAAGFGPKGIKYAFIKAMFYLSRLFTSKNSEQYYSNIVMLANKGDLPPVGFDIAAREMRYGKFEPDIQKKIIERLVELNKENFFDEHPGLLSFIKKEKEKFGL